MQNDHNDNNYLERKNLHENKKKPQKLSSRIVTHIQNSMILIQIIMLNFNFGLETYPAATRPLPLYIIIDCGPLMT